MPRMARLKEIVERNREIARLRGEGERPKDLARRFGLQPSYIGEICKDVKRDEEFERSPESLGPLSVRAFHILSKAGVHSLSSLRAFVASDQQWQAALRERHGATERILSDIAAFLAKNP